MITLLQSVMLVTAQYTVTITEHDGGGVKDQWNEWMVKWNTGMTQVTQSSSFKQMQVSHHVPTTQGDLFHFINVLLPVCECMNYYFGDQVTRND